MQTAKINAHMLNGETVVANLFCKVENEQPFTAQHSLRACKVALEIARRMNIVNKTDLTFLYWGVLLHDFGKLFLPVELLLKAEELSFEEYETLTSHVKLGHAALKDCLPEKVLEIVLYHHERYDGAGYPAALRGEAIPILARIGAVAGAYDAMLETTPYHKGMTLEEAADEIFWNCGTQFDPAVVKAFLDCYTCWNATGCG